MVELKSCLLIHFLQWLAENTTQTNDVKWNYMDEIIGSDSLIMKSEHVGQSIDMKNLLRQYVDEAIDEMRWDDS